MFECSIQLLQFQGRGIVHAGSLSQCHGLLGHLNRTFIVNVLTTPVLFLL